MLIKSPCYHNDRAIHALNIASHYKPETPENQAWVLDQMVRALTHCPIVTKTAQVGREVVQIEVLGDSQDYYKFLSDHPTWDKGIPP